MDEPFIGQIIMFGGNFAPRGWAFCDGQLVSISQNTALFSILGTTYGGDGRTTFGLPDMRGRVAMGRGNGPGLGLNTIQIGQQGGSAKVTLNSTQIPSHAHEATFKANNNPTATTTVNAHEGQGDRTNATDAYFATGGTSDGRSTTLILDGYSTSKNVSMKSDAVQVSVSQTEGTVSISDTGGGQPIPNIQPYLAINYVIALQGIFPSRS